MPTEIVLTGIVTAGVFLLISLAFGRKVKTVRDFYLAPNVISKISYFGAYCGTNVTFTAVFLYLAAQGYQLGYAALLWAPLCWLAGVILFATRYDKIEEFCKRGNTMHEYLGEAYDSKTLRTVAAVSTITVFVAAVGVEFYGFSWLLSQLSPDSDLSPLIIGVSLLAVMLVYTLVSGFIATVKTDMLQIFLVVVAVFALGIANIDKLHFSLPIRADDKDWVSPISGDGFITLFAYMVLFVPFHFAVMDTWQRCKAVGGERKSVATPTILGGVFVALCFAVPIWIGIGVAADFSLADGDPKSVFLQALPETPFLSICVFAGLIAALFSTADTLLLNAGYALVYDVLRKERVDSKSHSVFESSQAGLASVRIWVGLLGLGAIGGFAVCYWLPFDQIVMAVFSSQAILGFLILYYFHAGASARERKSGAIAAAICGFTVPIGVVILGKMLNDSQLADAAPLVAVVLAWVAFYAVPKAK